MDHDTVRAVAHVAEGALPVLVHVGFDRVTYKPKGGRLRKHVLRSCETTAAMYGVPKGTHMWIAESMLSLPATRAKRSSSQRRKDSRRKAQVLQRQGAGSELAQGAAASGSDTPVPTEVSVTHKPIERLAREAVWGDVQCACGNTWSALGESHTVSHCGQCSGQ